MTNSGGAAVRKPRLLVQQDRIYTTSVAVAEFFGKNHFHVIRDIAALFGGTVQESGHPKLDAQISISASKTEPRDSADARADDSVNRFMSANFTSSQYLDERGKTWPMYLLTKNGFVLLAMGFTGKKALQWKIRYIEAFDGMAAALAGNGPGRESVPVGLPGHSAFGVADLLPVCGGYRVPAQVLLVLLNHGADREPVSLSFRQIVRATDNQVSVAGVHFAIAHLERFGFVEMIPTRYRSYRVLPTLKLALERRQGSTVLPAVVRVH